MLFRSISSYSYLGGVSIYILINGINLHYEEEGEGDPIILLHGWGANLNTFNGLSNNLSSNFKIYRIDLPGFGESDIGLPVTIDENTEIIRRFVIELGINNPIILGHSYGGRIAINYASLYEVNKLILVSSAGVKQKLKLAKRIKVRCYKALKKMNINLKMGSSDYQNADNVRRIMLVEAVNKDLTEQMKKITAPTLLMYGDKDSVTPLELGYKIKSNINGSSLIILEGCRHFPYLERSSYFYLILNSFLIGDSNV